MWKLIKLSMYSEVAAVLWRNLQILAFVACYAQATLYLKNKRVVTTFISVVVSVLISTIDFLK